MTVDPIRHQSVFHPHRFGAKRVDVIGAGATGSRVAISLAKLGVTNLHVWDFDKIEEHNVANQAFGNDDIGKFKVEALAATIKRQCGIDITAHNAKYEGGEQLGNVVFLLTDSMASRKQIWESSIRLKPRTELMVETRMGADDGRVYAVNPMDPKHVKRWEATLYADSEAAVSACGAQTSVGPTAEIISGLAVWAMMQWFAWSNSEGEFPDFETIMGLRHLSVLTQSA